MLQIRLTLLIQWYSFHNSSLEVGGKYGFKYVGVATVRGNRSIPGQSRREGEVFFPVLSCSGFAFLHGVTCCTWWATLLSIIHTALSLSVSLLPPLPVVVYHFCKLLYLLDIHFIIIHSLEIFITHNNFNHFTPTASTFLLCLYNFFDRYHCLTVFIKYTLNLHFGLNHYFLQLFCYNYQNQCHICTIPSFLKFSYYH